MFTHLRTCSSPVPPWSLEEMSVAHFPSHLEVISLHTPVQVMDFKWVLLIENNCIFYNFWNVICLVSLMHTFG